MNILFLPSWYESSDEPNSGSFFTEQVKALQRMGNEVTIAIVDILNYPYKSNSPKYKIFKENRHEIDVYRMVIPSLMTGHVPSVFFSYYLHYYRKLIKFMTSEGLKFDVIYAHSFWHAGYIATVLKNELNLPLVTQEHRSMLVSGEFSNNVNKYLKATVIESDCFYCVSNVLKENVYSRIGINEGVELLPDMVDDSFRYRPLNNDVFTFTFIGTLNERKRIIQLLRCFETICKNNEKICLKVAGDGPLRDNVKEMIENSDCLKANVDLLGLLSREEIIDLLADSNALVLPRSFEPFGVVCIEAMAVGRPVICTKNGATDFVNASNGFLIDVDSDEQLISAMETMYKDYSKYDLADISRNCLALYSSENVMSRLMDKFAVIQSKKLIKGCC